MRAQRMAVLSTNMSVIDRQLNAARAANPPNQYLIGSLESAKKLIQHEMGRLQYDEAQMQAAQQWARQQRH